MSQTEMIMQGAIAQIREELDDHRQGINDNTNEVQANHEYIVSVESKLDFLMKRIDELELLLKGKKTASSFNVQPLNSREKEVFLVLYSLTNSQPFTTYKDIAKKLGMNENLVACYMTNMLEKGIPVVKKYSDGKVYLTLDKDFREVQARENIVGVNTLLTYWE